jgi:hypothetical protein
LVSFLQGLDVQKDIAEERVAPGRYFVLKFDFSRVYYGQKMNTAAGSSRVTYAVHLGGHVEEHSDKIDPEDPSTCHQFVEVCYVGQKRAFGGSGRRKTTCQYSRGKIWVSLAIISMSANLEIWPPPIYLLVDEYDTFSNSYLAPCNTFWEGLTSGMLGWC